MSETPLPTGLAIWRPIGGSGRGRQYRRDRCDSPDPDRYPSPYARSAASTLPPRAARRWRHHDPDVEMNRNPEIGPDTVTVEARDLPSISPRSWRSITSVLH